MYILKGLKLIGNHTHAHTQNKACSYHLHGHAYPARQAGMPVNQPSTPKSGKILLGMGLAPRRGTAHA